MFVSLIGTFGMGNYPCCEGHFLPSTLRKANVRPDHLFGIEIREELIGINYDLLDLHLFIVEVVPYKLANIVQFLLDVQVAPRLLEKRRRS